MFTAFLTEITSLKLRTHKIAFAPFFGSQNFAPPETGLTGARLRMISNRVDCSANHGASCRGAGRRVAPAQVELRPT
jgi:hypothetical protein